jgi:hypothetical protein
MKDWWDHPSMWVIGCIDSYGAISAREDNGRNPFHELPESRGAKWRWNIWKQEWFMDGKVDNLTKEERVIVEDWLERHGYKERFT